MSTSSCNMVKMLSFNYHCYHRRIVITAERGQLVSIWETSSASTRCTGTSVGGKVWPQITSMRPPSAGSSISDSTRNRRRLKQGWNSRYKDIRELKNNCKAAAQEGKRGYAAASFDQQQVRTSIETLSQ